MSLDQESTVAPASAPRGRWGEYTQLSRQIKQAGLLDLRFAGLHGFIPIFRFFNFFPQRFGFFLVEVCGSDFSNHHKRAFEQLGLGRLNDNVIGFP